MFVVHEYITKVLEQHLLLPIPYLQKKNVQENNDKNVLIA